MREFTNIKMTKILITKRTIGRDIIASDARWYESDSLYSKV